MADEHRYTANVSWTGNLGQGTRTYKGYARHFDITCPGKPTILGSADSAYLGDSDRHNPEDLLVAALAACHMLWYLHLCAVEKVEVAAYRDAADGAMRANPDGSGEFEKVTLRPHVTITGGSCAETAMSLHQRASTMCFIARSVNFPVEHIPEIVKA